MHVQFGMHTVLADPLQAFNPEQRAAVLHGRTPLLLVAGPGTGKTQTLAARAARLVHEGTDPQRLLLLTFSRRAAREMAQRCAVLLQCFMRPPNAAPVRQDGRASVGQVAQAGPLGTPAAALPWAGTFHAIGARLLREAGPALGLAAGFTVLDRADAEDLMAIERQALGLATQRNRFPLKATCLALHSRVVNTGLPLEQVLTEQFPWCAVWHSELKALFGAYARAKRRQQVLDFDDLLLYWAEALADESIARAWSGRFDHVLVDEYQDTNRLQATIVQRLRPGGLGLTVVGDDAQSIYAFRGADWRNMLDFPDQYGASTRVLALEQNYRSTPALLAASNALIAQASERHAKTLWSELTPGPRPQLVTVADEAAQAAWATDEVLRQREAGIALRQQAVLFRTASHSARLELELTRRQVPFVKYGGLKFMQSSHVKDLLSLLRWAQNPRHALAAYRCALLVPGLGPASARKLLTLLDQAVDGAPPPLADFKPPPSAREAWRHFLTIWSELHHPDCGWPQAVDSALRWYLPQLQRLHTDAAVREADLRQLQQIAAGYPSRERFLAELTLDPPQASSDEPGVPHRDEDYLILSTIHSAKGQEWSAVQVLNVVDGCLPADMATGSAAEIAEERRLLYVAMTRAKRHLSLLVPQRFHVTQQARHGDRHLYAARSRFIDEAVAGCCDLQAGTVEAPADALALTAGADSADRFADRLLGRWD